MVSESPTRGAGGFTAERPEAGPPPARQGSKQNAAVAIAACSRGSTAFGPGGRMHRMETARDESSALASQWLEEFEAAARRPLKTRFRYSFIHTYKPVLDDEPYRAFDTMEDYRRWCEANLPDWLGYGRV